MIRHLALTDQQLRLLLKARHITLAGHGPSRIYGLLRCPSGRKMGRKNRVFFANETEAITEGFRPCGRCLPLAYKIWRNQASA
jgi:hypothetical protein